ncbi:MAG: DUF2634 domain-containing protein [Candidatus Pristimantibacillus sp.]
MALEPEITVPEIYSRVAATSRTYALDVVGGRVRGMIDGKSAIEQFIFKSLRTARYEHLIYSNNYGSEHHLLGSTLNGVTESELTRTITEALIYDERIIRVYDFEFAQVEDSLSVSFKVESTEGDIPYIEVI